MRDAEKTKKHILDTAQKLFFIHGYNNTTMKDIMDDGDLSKGAIYHHFKSKREIFDQIMYKLDNNGKKLSNVLMSAELSGLDKLKQLIYINLTNEEKAQVLAHASSLFADDKVYGEMIRKNKEFIPHIMQVIAEGNADGTMSVVYPRELADQFIQFFNIWIGTELYGVEPEALQEKVSFYKKLFADNGIQLIDEDIEKLIYAYAEIFR